MADKPTHVCINRRRTLDPKPEIKSNQTNQKWKEKWKNEETSAKIMDENSEKQNPLHLSLHFSFTDDLLMTELEIQLL